jgi:hypothetical protein
VSPYVLARAVEFDLLSHGTEYGGIYEIRHCLHVPYQLDDDELIKYLIVGTGILKPQQITYFLESPERPEVSLHFGEHAERYCEPAHWIYITGDIHYGQFQLRRWSYRFRAR